MQAVKCFWRYSTVGDRTEQSQILGKYCKIDSLQGGYKSCIPLTRREMLNLNNDLVACRTPFFVRMAH
jgi:hypothetical protein